MTKFVTVLKDLNFYYNHGSPVETLERGQRFRVLAEEVESPCGPNFTVRLKSGRRVRLLACEVAVCGVSESLDLEKITGELPPAYCSAAADPLVNNHPIEGDPVNLF